MEAANTRRAAIRLAGLALCVVLTLVFAASAVRALLGRPGEQVAEASRETAVAWPPDDASDERDLAETDESVSLIEPPTIPAIVPYAGEPDYGELETLDEEIEEQGPPVLPPLALDPPAEMTTEPLGESVVGPRLEPATEAIADADADADSAFGTPEATIFETQVAESDAADADAPPPVTAPAFVASLVDSAEVESLPSPPITPLPGDRDAVADYTATLEGVNDRLLPEVRAGFNLGRAGALYAARARFVGVMRKIALAKDADAATTKHARLLAEGLRALDEAEDFVPRGDALEAELDTRAIAASHSTPVVRELPRDVAPSTAVALYSDYAAERLGAAVAGQQAGSMACYGLGKTYARLEAQSDNPDAGRKSAVMHRAALNAHPANYLAANELGVRLAKLGRYELAGEVLRTAVADGAPVSTIHANLAQVERRLGNASGADAAQTASQQIARREIATGAVSRRHGVQWVSPDAFRKPQPSRVASAPPAPPTATQPQGVGQAAPSGWKATFDKLRRATGWAEAPTPPRTAPARATPTPPPALAGAPQRVLR